MTLTQKIALLMAAFWLTISSAAYAQQPDFPERGTSPVVDLADVLDPNMEAQLTAALDEFEQTNQRQFVVATIPSLGDYDIADYGYQLGRHWGLGDAENNDGIILLIAPNERRVRIEVGYGLEAIMPDGMAHDIIQRQIIPQFKAGDMQAGIIAGAGAIVAHLQLPPEEAALIASEVQEGRSEGGFPVGTLIWLGFMFFFFILPMFRGGGRRRGYRGGGAGSVAGNIILWEVGSAIARGASGGGGWGGGGGGGFGGGGFGGGGGSFGGGGASGGW